MGGQNIRVENCYSYGDGYYPHRMTVVKGKNDELPREQGRHNTLFLVDYFANENFPESESDIHFKDCVFEGLKGALLYYADSCSLQNGTYLGEFTFENVRFTDVKEASTPMAKENHPLKVVMKDVSVSFATGIEQTELFIANKNSFVTLIKE